MKIDYSPLTQKIDDEVINNYIKKDGSKLSIISSGFCRIVKISIIVYFLIITVISAVLAYYYESFLLVFSGIFIPLLFPPFTGFIILSIRGYQLTRYKKLICLSEFARCNNFTYEENCIYQKYPGIIFNVGNERRTIDMIIKESALGSFEIANYSYSVGSGDEKRTHSLGYIMIKLGRKLPNMILDSKMNNLKVFGGSVTNLPIALKNSQKLSLEGDFDKHFTLYAPKEYERDALYVFTPDLMAAFIDHSGQYDAEVVDDMLFVYSQLSFDMLNAEVMERLFNIINAVGGKTLSQTDRYSDEKVGDRTKDVVAVSGQRLRPRTNLAVILFIVSIIIFTAIAIIMQSMTAAV